MTAALSRAPDLFDPAPALDFLQALGKNPETACFRAIHASRQGTARKVEGWHPAELERLQREGFRLYLVIGEGGHRVADITGLTAVFCEWDDRPIAWQVHAWKELGLPEPSLMVSTGGKSLHCYWLLEEPMAPGPWRELQTRLIAHAGADPSCKDASRVMRLPGSSYLAADGTATGRAEILHQSDRRYSPQEIAACLSDPTQPELPATPPRAAQTTAGTIGPRQPRSLEEIRAAAELIPVRVGGQGTYPQDRNALCGCAAALAEIGLPEAMALDLLGHQWPTRREAEQVLETTTTRNAASFWAIAAEHGYRLSNKPANNVVELPPRPQQQVTGTPEARQPVPQVLTTEQVRQRLAEAIGEGLSRADEAALVAHLAASSDLSAQSIQRIADAITSEHEQAAAIKAESSRITAEADRKELGQALTLEYLLPPAIAHALRVRCLALPTDDVAAAVTYLVALSGLAKLGTRVVASRAADYRVPVNLYAALVARSGAKKSPVSRLLVNAPTQELQRELAIQHSRLMRDWEERSKGVKPADREPEPKAAHLMVNDTTGEKLADQLQTQEKAGLGLLLHRDELAGLIGSFDKYSQGRGSDQELYLEAYDGSGFRSLRITAPGGGRFYERCHLSIWGTIQPAILQGLVADGDGSGLWARFLFVPLPERVVPLPDSESEAEQRAAADAAQTLADVARRLYSLPKADHHLDAAARVDFSRYEARCQKEALEATIPAQSAIYGKAAGKVLRVAGLLHLLAKVAGQGEAEISAATIERATALVDHLNGWALSFHADIANGGPSDLMRKVHRIALEAAAPIRWKDVSPRFSKKERREIDCAAVGAAMDALAELGVGTVERGARGAAVYRALRPLP